MVIVDEAGRRDVTLVMRLAAVLSLSASEDFFDYTQEITLLLSTAWLSNEVSIS